MAFLGVAFLAAVAVALSPPQIKPSNTASVDVADTPLQPGTFEILERPDLRPPLPRQMAYQSAPIPDAVRYVTQDGDRFRPWHVYAPPAADSTAPRPAVLLFHGANRDSLSMIDMWQEVARREGIILIGLNALDGRWTDGTFDPEYLFDVLDEAAQHHAIDTSALYLFGHSDGAIIVQLIANLVPDPWRAAAAHAGYTVPELFEPQTAAPPVRHYLGTRDGIFHVEPAIDVGQQMAAMGQDHTLVLIPGHTHWFNEGGPVIAADAWTWFDTL